MRSTTSLKLILKSGSQGRIGLGTLYCVIQERVRTKLTTRTR
jgi:hypothetical protein